MPATDTTQGPTTSKTLPGAVKPASAPSKTLQSKTSGTSEELEEKAPEASPSSVPERVTLAIVQLEFYTDKSFEVRISGGERLPPGWLQRAIPLALRELSRQKVVARINERREEASHA